MIVREIKLHIRFRFNGLENIVATFDGTIYQLPHYHNRTKIYRQINKVKIGGSIGYRIDRQFYTSTKIKQLAYKVDEFIKVGETEITPF